VSTLENKGKKAYTHVSLLILGFMEVGNLREWDGYAELVYGPDIASHYASSISVTYLGVGVISHDFPNEQDDPPPLRASASCWTSLGD